MEGMISYCGLVCGKCPIYLASRETDKIKKDEMISEIIRICKKEYNIEYTTSDITDCDGCMSDTGRLFSGCRDCRIRNCVINKGILNCAYCSNYVCDNLNSLFKTDPSAKTRLDLIKKNY
jgi:hypothetical protein